MPTKHNNISRQQLRDAIQSPVSTEGWDDFSADAIRGMQYAGTPEDFDAALERIHSKIDAASPAKRVSIHNKRNRLLSIAAVLVLLLGVALWLKPAPQSSNQVLAAAYFEALPPVLYRDFTPRSPGSQHTNDIKARNLALAFYGKADFKSALPHFTTYLQAKPEDQEIRFYYAQALLANHQANAALDALEVVEKNLPRPAFTEPVIWYQAIAALQADKTDLAKVKLKTLIEQDSRDYATQAAALLEDLTRK